MYEVSEETNRIAPLFPLIVGLQNNLRFKTFLYSQYFQMKTLIDLPIRTIRKEDIDVFLIIDHRVTHSTPVHHILM
jgi:hypothetical protein